MALKPQGPLYYPGSEVVAEASVEARQLASLLIDYLEGEQKSRNLSDLDVLDALSIARVWFVKDGE